MHFITQQWEPGLIRKKRPAERRVRSAPNPGHFRQSGRQAVASGSKDGAPVAAAALTRTMAHLVFATLVARHTTAVLARLAQELKTAHELREYAKSLLEESEQLFVADVEAWRPGPDRLQRLRSSIEFTRQLFEQHTALEPASLPGLLDEQITAVVAAEPGRPFSRELALAIDQSESRRASAS